MTSPLANAMQTEAWQTKFCRKYNTAISASISGDGLWVNPVVQWLFWLSESAILGSATIFLLKLLHYANAAKSFSFSGIRESKNNNDQYKNSTPFSNRNTHHKLWPIFSRYLQICYLQKKVSRQLGLCKLSRWFGQTSIYNNETFG